MRLKRWNSLWLTHERRTTYSGLIVTVALFRGINSKHTTLFISGNGRTLMLYLSKLVCLEERHSSGYLYAQSSSRFFRKYLWPGSLLLEMFPCLAGLYKYTCGRIRAIET